MEPHLSPEIYERLESEIGTQVKLVQKIILEQHKLSIPEECLEFVVRCLRQKDVIIDKAVKLILAFHTVIKDFGNWKSALKPSLHSEFFTTETCYFNPLSQKDDAGRTVLLFRTQFWSPKTMSMEELATCLWMFMQHVNQRDQDIQRRGHVLIFDCSNFTMEQAWALKFKYSLAISRWVQNGIMGRMKQCHMVNHPKFIDALYLALAPFLSEKIKKRVYLHKKVETLLEYVPARILPVYLGGTATDCSYRNKELLAEIIHRDDYFQDMLMYGFPSR